MSTSRPTNAHIHVIPKNDKGGDDKIIGDLHGNRECLEAVLEQIGPGDRLFIAGDLTDRGEDSPGVIRTIIENNAKSDAGKIYCIRGNHEDLCLDALSGLEIRASQLKKTAETKVQEWIPKLKETPSENLDLPDLLIKAHVKNGGDWLVKLFYEELTSTPNKIMIDANNNITYADDSSVKMIKDYMSSLPYIMHVEGTQLFNVVHADMPINDAELQRRIHSGEGLSDREIKHAIWVREGKKGEPIQDVGNNKNSCAKYTGHSITTQGARPTRDETNTVNLDVGAYSEMVSLIANHTQGNCEWVGPGINNINQDTLGNEIKDVTNQHMATQHTLSDFLEESSKCSSVNDLEQTVEKWMSILSSYNKVDLTECAINNNALRDTLLTNTNCSELTKLLEYGLDPKMYLSDGSTLLHHAVAKGQVDSVELLLNNGADPAQQDLENSCTALQVGIQTHNMATLQQLTSFYEDKGTTALHAVASNGNTKLTTMLLNHGLSLDNRNNKGATPLHLAANNGHASLVTLLLSQGADANAILPGNGHTPLHITVANNNTQTTEALLKGGANPNTALEVSGFTPLHIAANEGKPEMVELLIENGANANETILTTAMQVDFFFNGQGSSESIQGKVEDFLRDKNPEKIEIKPEEIAQIMGHTDIQEILQKAAEQQLEMDNSNKPSR